MCVCARVRLMFLYVAGEVDQQSCVKTSLCSTDGFTVEWNFTGAIFDTSIVVWSVLVCDGAEVRIMSCTVKSL